MYNPVRLPPKYNLTLHPLNFSFPTPTTHFIGSTFAGLDEESSVENKHQCISSYFMEPTEISSENPKEDKNSKKTETQFRDDSSKSTTQKEKNYKEKFKETNEQRLKRSYEIGLRELKHSKKKIPKATARVAVFDNLVVAEIAKPRTKYCVDNIYENLVIFDFYKDRSPNSVIFGIGKHMIFNTPWCIIQVGCADILTHFGWKPDLSYKDSIVVWNRIR